MERQKLWLCIGIACVLLLTVAAAIVFASADEQPDRGASFVSARRERTVSAYRMENGGRWL